MKVREYVRTKWGYICKIININDFREPSMKYGVEASYLKDIMFIGDEDIIKSSLNILELLEPQDLLYVDIDNGYAGGIIVPRIPETINELNDYIKKIKSGELILKGVVTREQLMERMFEVNK